MSKISKESFQYFKGVYELHCGWIVDDDYFKEVIEPELNKMRVTQIRAEFMFKCLYPNERPLSKEDYKRTRYAHRKICDKHDCLAQVRTKSENESFQRMCRKLQIQKGIYPLGLSFDEAMDDEEIKDFYETGRYKGGSFVAKCIVPLNRL